MVRLCFSGSLLSASIHCIHCAISIAQKINFDWLIDWLIYTAVYTVHAGETTRTLYSDETSLYVPNISGCNTTIAQFYPQDVVLVRVLAGSCVCVSLCVCLSVTCRFCIETAARIELLFSYRFSSTHATLRFREIKVSPKQCTSLWNFDANPWT